MDFYSIVEKARKTGKIDKGINEVTKATAEIKKINSISTKVLKILEISIPAEEILNEIENSKPSGITISKKIVEIDKGNIEISGVSSDRSSLIEFKQRLEENDHFSNVFVPISSLEIETNIDYKMSLNYQNPEEVTVSP